MTNQTPYRLHASLGYHLSVAARLQEKRLDDKLKSLELTRITWCILLAVGIENLFQPSDIANFVGIDRTATSRSLRQMESQNLLERSSGTGDRRTRLVRLTKAGQTALDAATPFAMENAKIMSDRLTATEKTDLMRLLAKLRRDDDPRLDRL